MGALPPSFATAPSTDSGRRAEAVLAAHLASIRSRADLLFGSLLIFLWVTAVATAWVADGNVTAVAVLALGAPLTIFPACCIVWRRGSSFTRHLITAALMLWSALLVQFSGGRVETHFLVFGALALLAWYRDWRLPLTA